MFSDLGVDGWELVEDDFWCRVSAPDAASRVQGWKLHVSATPLSAPEVLHRAACVLIRHECAFKFAASAKHVEQLTSARCDRAQCGKFIAAYPKDDDEFRELAEELDKATAGLPGPAILSDRPYRKGSVVHYRYGAFRGVPYVNNEGVQEARLRAPDGTAVEDARKPWFCPPPWAELPFAGSAGWPSKPPVDPKQVLLRDRYVVREAIRHSARGGVYRALDQETGRDVVIKQARAHVGGGHTGRDARDALRGEAAALAALSGLSAELVEVFEQDDHVFLVETLVPGVPLTRWVQERLDTIKDREVGLPVDEVVSMAASLAGLLGEIHRRGLVYRDLSPNNVMVTPDDELLLIDPEFVAEAGQWAHRAYTPGYGAPECVAGPLFGPVPEQAADLFSLGVMLFYVVTGANAAFADDQPDPRPPVQRLDAVLSVVGGRNGAARLLAPAIRGLCAQDPARRWPLERLTAFLADAAPTSAEARGGCPVRLVPASQERLIDDGLGHVLATVTPPLPEESGFSLPSAEVGDGQALPVSNTETISVKRFPHRVNPAVPSLDSMGEPDAARLWPSTPFGMGADACGVQHGAAGVLGVLTRASEVLGRQELRAAVARVASWIDARLTAVPKVLPGLYFGRAGTAWTLHEAARHLGDEELAEHAVELALALPLRWPNPDLFHGAAGAGVTQLRFWQVTGRPEFLGRAAECADGLLTAAEYADDGVFWRIPPDFDSSLAGITHLGFAHGVAGVGSFFVDAAAATGRQDYVDVAMAAGRTLAGAAERGPWGARWRTDRAGRPGEGMLYHLCSGASGAGTFLLRLWRVTRDPVALELAEEAAAAVYRTRWNAGSAVCHGLAGNGEFLLDMAQAVGGPYHGWAAEIAACLHARHAVRDGRMVVPDESGTEVTVDYAVGLSGVIGFLLRLRYGGPRMLMTDIDRPLSLAGSDRQAGLVVRPA